MIKRQYISSIILSCVICLPLLLIISYNYYQYQYKKTAQQRLKSAQTITIILATKNINWVQPNKELLYNNRMFDVKKLIIKKDSVICTGWYDDEETELSYQYENYKHKKKQALLQLKIQLNQLFYNNYNFEITHAYHLIKKNSFTNFNIYKKSISFTLDLLKPPQINSTYTINSCC